MANKYKYIKVIQQYFDTWEDVSEYVCNSQYITIEKHVNKDNKTVSLLSHDLKEYKLTGYPTRVVKRRVLNN